MAGNEEEEKGVSKTPDFVYRISTAEEWEVFQKEGKIFGGDLDKNSGFIHLSNLDQVWDPYCKKLQFGEADCVLSKLSGAHRDVIGTLRNFFQGREDLYLLQIDTKKLGEGLVYEAVDGSTYFPHFYGPSRSFIPLSLDAVAKSEKLEFVGDEFSCSLLK